MPLHKKCQISSKLPFLQLLRDGCQDQNNRRSEWFWFVVFFCSSSISILNRISISRKISQNKDKDKATRYLWIKMLQQSIWLRRLIIASRPCPLNGKKFSVNTKFCIHHHHHCHYKHHHHHHHHEESASNVAKFLHPPLRPPKSGKSPLHDFFFFGGGAALLLSHNLKKTEISGRFLI